MIFDPGTLAQLRNTQEASMMHECTVEAYIVDNSAEAYLLDTEGTVRYGDPVNTVCGFKALSSAERGADFYEVIQAEAEIRFPLSVKVGMKDRVTLTKSFGVALDPARCFEVCAFPDSFGPSGQVVRVKEVFN